MIFSEFVLTYKAGDKLNVDYNIMRGTYFCKQLTSNFTKIVHLDLSVAIDPEVTSETMMMKALMSVQMLTLLRSRLLHLPNLTTLMRLLLFVMKISFANLTC